MCDFARRDIITRQGSSSQKQNSGPFCGMEVGVRIRLLAVFFGLLVCLSAQDIRGVISGTVIDAQGANVVGATVVVTNTGTNVSTTLTSNTSGFYQAPLLAP